MENASCGGESPRQILWWRIAATNKSCGGESWRGALTIWCSATHTMSALAVQGSMLLPIPLRNDGTDCTLRLTCSHTKAQYDLAWSHNVGVAPKRFVHMVADLVIDGRSLVIMNDDALAHHASFHPSPRHGLLVPFLWTNVIDDRPPITRRVPQLVVAVHNLTHGVARRFVKAFRDCGAGMASCYTCSDGTWVTWAVHQTMIDALLNMLDGGGAPVSIRRPAWLVALTHGTGSVTPTHQCPPEVYHPL